MKFYQINQISEKKSLSKKIYFQTGASPTPHRATRGRQNCIGSNLSEPTDPDPIQFFKFADPWVRQPVYDGTFIEKIFNTVQTFQNSRVS